MSSTTSPNRGYQEGKISRSMKDMSNPTTEEESGSKKPKKLKELEPWDIAILPISLREGKPVDVEHSSDQEFQTWVTDNNIPVDDDGITEWDFDNKIGVINYAIQHGLKPRLVAPLPNCLENYSELFEHVKTEEKNDCSD